MPGTRSAVTLSYKVLDRFPGRNRTDLPLVLRRLAGARQKMAHIFHGPPFVLLPSLACLTAVLHCPAVFDKGLTTADICVRLSHGGKTACPSAQRKAPQNALKLLGIRCLED